MIALISLVDFKVTQTIPFIYKVRTALPNKKVSGVRAMQ
jgi:hypothetical protein